MSNIKKYVAEMIGTAILVFMGCGSAVLLGAASPGGHLAVAIAFGLSIVASAYVIGSVSGCHLNPAVSLAMLIDKRLKVNEFVGYVISQIVGALIAALLLKMFVQFGVTDQTGSLGSNMSGAGGGGVAGALFAEIILTFIFVLTILGVTSKQENGAIAGVVIGLTLTFVHIVGIPIDGTSVNPARSIGPALFSGNMQAISELWLFILAPLLGAALAALLYGFYKKQTN